MKHSLLRAILPSFLILFALHSFGEGTKQFRPVQSNFGEICIDTTATRTKFAWVTASADYRLYIHITDYTTEAIYFGFGEKKHNLGATEFRLYRPNGTIDTSGTVPTTTGSRGYIDNWTKATTGPSVVAGPSGYWALRCTPDMNGDYYLAFKITWATGFGVDEYQTFADFDATVVKTTNWSAIDGRLWSKSWQLYAENPSWGTSNQYWGSFYVYSADSIITRVNLNGMIPGTFNISCNESGCYQIDATHPAAVARKSVSGNHTYPQYKIFLNDPDNVVYPSGTLGGLDNNVPVTTNRKCDGTIDFTFKTTKAGNVEIHLLLSALGPPYVDRILPSQVTNGYNTITWDGLDGNGVAVPNGATFPFYISYVNGLTHLPLYDVEFNQNGFLLSLIRPTTVPAPPDPLFYWDDTQIGGASNFAGCLPTPTVGCHIWTGPPNGFGNNRTINTWWYAVSTSTTQTQITERRSPGALGTITGPTSLCPGQTSVMYSVSLDPNSTSYQWVYSGTGATIVNNGNNVITIDYDVTATSGVLSVQGYNAECGLSGIPSNLSITMKPFPPVVLDPFTPVCINTPAFTLTGGSPAGGTYFIDGTPATIFDPATEGIGTSTISYYYADPVTTCTKTVAQPLVVNALPVVTFQPLASVCSYVTPFPLTGGSPAGGIYSGPGVTGGIFDPAAAGPGTWTITYTYTDPNSCVNSTTQQITVNPAPLVTLADFTPVCINLPPFALSGGSPPGGTYSGPGVTGGIFDPSASGTGTFPIKYKYSDANGCPDSVTKNITVNPLPGAAGTITGTASLCQGATGIAYSIAPVANTVGYIWTLLPGGSGTFSGSGNSVTVNWGAAFTGNATLTVTPFNGCGDGTISPVYNVVVNPKPNVSYAFCTDSVTTTNAKPFLLRGGLPLGGTYSGPGVNSTTGLFSPAVAGVGIKTIRYQYVNTWGCSSLVNKTITVINPALFACGGTYKDVRDNKNYRTILIGSQCWMADNLNYGSFIFSFQNQRDNCIPEKFCYSDNLANCTSNGGLYEWNEIMTYDEATGIQGLCPPAWHIPTESEWTTLFSNYVNNGFAASALKYSGFSGFDALLSGVEHSNKQSDYTGFATFHWTSSSHGVFKAWAHGMNDPDPSVSFYPSNRNHAFSVRCVKD